MSLQHQSPSGSQQSMGQGSSTSTMQGSYGGGQQMGQQMMGQRLQDVETPEERAALDGIQRAVAVCEWCADQCVQHADPNMVECIRLCEDVSELGETVLTLIPRRSRYAGTALQAFQQAVEACARECSRHQHAHCQECSQVLGGTANATRQFLSSTGQQGGPSMGGVQ